jgi:homotetrameric cytidine deaminase
MQNAAIRARGRAYAPYSQFYVGAALWTTPERIITGANVENASYGLSLCAERAALVAAVADGITAKQMGAMLVVADAPQMTAPCGACRQVLFELCPHDMPIILVNLRDNSCQTHSLATLLPYAFGPQTLGQSAL